MEKHEGHTHVSTWRALSEGRPGWLPAIGLALLVTVVLLGGALPGTPGATANPAFADKPSSGDPPPAAGSGARLKSMGLYNSPTGRTVTAFSASRDNYVYVKMVWSGISGQHEGHLIFTSPDNKVYQVLDVPFSTTGPNGPADGKLMPAEGVAGPNSNAHFAQKQKNRLHPVSVQVAPPARGDNSVTVWAQLPVAGTWMPRLPGQWTVGLRLDDQATLFATQTFRLNR